MFIVKMEETDCSKMLLIPLRCPHGFDEGQLNLGMCEEGGGGGGGGKQGGYFKPSGTK
jgi:hypothetical protein